MSVFADRASAGRSLGAALTSYRGREDVLVLGLPRGGVPVASEVASALLAPLDVLVVRKLSAPGQPELALGALAPDGVMVLNEGTANLWGSSAAFQAELARERAELRRREALYRNERLPLDVAGRTTILVDDGAATGATMVAAIRAMRRRGAGRIVAAVPVASADALGLLHREADQVECLIAPASFESVGDWYRDFEQTSDTEVAVLLARTHNTGYWKHPTDAHAPVAGERHEERHRSAR
jgi:predicted phosphoribosyltransferase